MQSTRHSPERTGTRRFRAPTIDAALELARAELGPDVEVIEANRIRRGGVGGFFATDLGVEIVVDVPAAAPALSGGKPHFYDREIEEERAVTAASLERLIEDVTRAERAAHREQSTPVDAAHGAGRFSDVLARELALDGAGVSPRRLDSSPGAAAETAATDVRDPIPSAPPAGARSVAREPDEQPEPPRARHARRVHKAARAPEPEPSTKPAARSRRAVRADRPATDSVAGDRRPRRGDGQATPAAAPAKRDPWRRPSELATAAASRLIADLAEVVARDGSRVEDLSRLRVSITTPDGAVIELTAEMDGRCR